MTYLAFFTYISEKSKLPANKVTLKKSMVVFRFFVTFCRQEEYIVYKDTKVIKQRTIIVNIVRHELRVNKAMLVDIY